MAIARNLVIGAAVIAAGLSVAAKLNDPLDKLVDEDTLVNGMVQEVGRQQFTSVNIEVNPGDDSTCLTDYVLTTRDGSTVTVTVPRVGDSELRDSTFGRDLTCVGDVRYNLRQGVDAVRDISYGVCAGVTDGKSCGTSVLGSIVGFFQSIGRGFAGLYSSTAGTATDLSQRAEEGYKAATK